MNKNDDDSASDTGDPGQPGVSDQHNDCVPDVLDKEVADREDAVIDGAAAASSREKFGAVGEHAADLHDVSSTAREQEPGATESVEESPPDQMMMLQQANAHLVIATIEARKMAEQVEMAKVQLESAKVVAEKANLAKSDFLSSMSHELRSPLNAILGFAQLLESGSPPPTPGQKASLDQILKAGWYLLELINEILDLALIESGKLSLSLEPISLPDVLRDCQAMIEPQAQKKGIRISFPQCDFPYLVHADRTRVKQVLINLISNAIKYNRAGGTVDVTCSVSNAERIRISVIDSGEGLSQEQLAQLFQPFNRLGQESKAEEGTGIGLAMSKRLVELMGGEVGVQSTVGVGSVFWFELNLAAEMPLEAAADDLNALHPAHQRGAVLRTLLYVEDNRTNLQLVEQIIARRPDMRLLSAGDGAHGIALARSNQPEVILMDINLPGISGLQALKILRADPLTAHIPVLALSANAMPRDIKKGLAAGFFRYLTKPIKIDVFLEALDQALELAKAASGAAIHPELLDR